MCWSLRVSLVATLGGWATCLFLLFRKGPRDAFYARYLVTFTGTQLIDMFLWFSHASIGPYGETVGGLQSCSELQFQFGRFLATDGDRCIFV